MRKLIGPAPAGPWRADMAVRVLIAPAGAVLVAQMVLIVSEMAKPPSSRYVSPSSETRNSAFFNGLLRVAPGGPPAASKTLRVAQATLGGLLLADRTPPDAMTRLSIVRNPV